MTETWKAVPGLEGKYEVSDQGRVRSLDRMLVVPSRWGGTTVRKIVGRVLRPGRSGNGYLTVSLSAGKGESFLVQDLVLAAFVGPKPPGQCSRHEDDDKDNNRLSNLLYGTQSQNARDRTTNGGRMFSREDAEEIKKLVAAGRSQLSVAGQFGCTRRHVNYIVNGVHYAP